MVFLLNLQRNFNRIQTLTNHCNNIGYEDKALSDDGNPRSGHCYDEYDDDIVREGGQSHTSAQRYMGRSEAHIHLAGHTVCNRRDACQRRD